MEIENAYAVLMSNVLTGEGKSFVVFENGTVVVLVDAPPEMDLVTVSTDLLTKHGPVQTGGPGGDFGVIYLPNDIGWVVTCHHGDILTVVLPDEMEDDAPELSIGLYGRSKRGTDSDSAVVVHVQDNRRTDG